MRPELADQALVLDMLDSARAVVEMVSGMTCDSYAADRRTRRAVEREIEIIGEAARKVSQEFQTAHPEIPRRKKHSARTSRPTRSFRTFAASCTHQ